jgi:hypothetical protein
MEFEENILRATLNEVEALKLLRAQKVDHKTELARRAYFSKAQRDAFAKLSPAALSIFFSSGESIHIPFLEEEKLAILSVYNFRGKKLTATDLNSISE